MTILTMPIVDVGAGLSTPSGAKLNFYEAGTTTRLATYTDSALSVAHTNPVVADGNGVFAAIYTQNKEYKIVLTDSDDVVIWTVDPYYTPIVDIIADLTALKLVEGSANQIIYLKGLSSINDSGEGHFYWNASSTATADDGNVIQATGVTTGRWIRMFQGHYDSINSLPTSSFDGHVVEVTSFYDVVPSVVPDGGGGQFVWDKNGDAADHDGGTIIDPSHSITPGATGYWTPETGTGVWRRICDVGNYNVRHFGAKGDNSNDDTGALQGAIRAASLYNDTSSDEHAGVEFPAGIYRTSSPLEVSRKTHLYCSSHRMAIVRANHTGAAIYNADYDSVTDSYTEHLQDGLGGDFQDNISITNIHFDHIGTISGSSPDSLTPYRAVMQFHNSARLNLNNIRIDSKTNNIGMLNLRNCYFSTLTRINTARGSGYHGGNAVWLMANCNNISLRDCQIYGGFETGYRVDAGTYDSISDNISAITFDNCDAENVDYKNVDSDTSYGTGYGIWLGGDDPAKRLRGVSIFAGYYENCNVDVQVGSSNTGSQVVNFLSQNVFHADNATSINCYKIVNAVGHRIINPRMSGWLFKFLTLTSVTGTPVEGETVTLQDRWGTNITAIVVDWDSGTSLLTVRNLQGDPDLSSTVTTPSMTSATLSTFSQAVYYGASGNPHFNITSGMVIGGYYELTWHDSQNFKPSDVGLDDGDGTIKINGLTGETSEYRSGALYIGDSNYKVPLYRNTTAYTKAEVEAGIDIYKIIIPQDNYPQMIDLRLDFTHTCTYTSSPNNNNDSSTVNLSIMISRAYNVVDSNYNANVLHEVGVKTGTQAAIDNVTVGMFTVAGLSGSGAHEITLTYTATGVSTSTDNYLVCNGIVNGRQGAIRIYADSGL